MRRVYCAILACLLLLLTSCTSGVSREGSKGGQPDSGRFDIGVTDKPTASTEPVVSTDEPISSTDMPVNPTAMSALRRAQMMLVRLENGDMNVLYSPASLEMALGLLAEGAVDETRYEILNFLGVDEYLVVARALIDSANEVNSLGSEAFGYHTALKIANSLWVNDDYSLNTDFQGVAQDFYGATAGNLNFRNPTDSANVINSWCDDNTNGLIREIVKPDMIKDDLALILCNSLYFESGWYDKWDVRDGKFTNSDGTVTELNDMLYSTEKLYYETDNAVAFGKRYIAGQTFIGILLNEGVAFEDIDLDALLNSETAIYDVHASMPKLNYEYTTEGLVEVLKSFGVVDIFSEECLGLSALLNESDQLSVSEVLQKCKIELDENGTKAAAVTGMFVADNAAPAQPNPSKEVHLNRPFYYMIIDEQSAQVLFIGAVNTVE